MAGFVNSIKVYNTWFLLKMTYGLFFIIVGADKFFNIIAPWSQYIGQHVLSLLSIDKTAFVHAIGGLEIVIGIMILIGITRLGAYLGFWWLMALALNLLLMHSHFEALLYVIVVAIGSLTLARLTYIKNSIE